VFDDESRFHPCLAEVSNEFAKAIAGSEVVSPDDGPLGGDVFLGASDVRVSGQVKAAALAGRVIEPVSPAPQTRTRSKTDLTVITSSSTSSSMVRPMPSPHQVGDQAFERGGTTYQKPGPHGPKSKASWFIIAVICCSLASCLAKTAPR
jgi:hypothetical protein